MVEPVTKSVTDGEGRNDHCEAHKASGLKYRLFSRLCHLNLLSLNIDGMKVSVNGR